MATDMLLGGFLLTREEWDALDDDERMLLVFSAIAPRPEEQLEVPESYYESYEVVFEEKLAS